MGQQAPGADSQLSLLLVGEQTDNLAAEVFVAPYSGEGEGLAHIGKPACKGQLVWDREQVLFAFESNASSLS